MRKRRFFSSPCLSSAREVWGGHGRVRLYCTRGNTVGSHAASPAAAETTTIAHPQSSSQKLLESLKRWEPLSNTVEWFNTNILQYDGVFRHKQNLDQTFLNLKQKEARQQEIDLELEDCQKRMYGVLQGKGSIAAQKEVFDKLIELRAEKDGLGVTEHREKYERQYEHFVNEDLRFRLKMQAATWWATILSAVVWLIYSCASWLTNEDRKNERLALTARLDNLQNSINTAAASLQIPLPAPSTATSSSSSPSGTSQQQQQPQQPQHPSAAAAKMEAMLRDQLREVLLGRVASMLRQQKDLRCQWFGGRTQRLAIERHLKNEVAPVMLESLVATLNDRECGPARYDKVDNFIRQWKAGIAPPITK